MKDITDNSDRIRRYAYYLLGLGSGFLIGGLANYTSSSSKRELLLPIAGVIIMVVAGAIASSANLKKQEPKGE